MATAETWTRWATDRQRVRVTTENGEPFDATVTAYVPASLRVELDDGGTAMVQPDRVTATTGPDPDDASESLAIQALGGGAEGRALLARLRAVGLDPGRSRVRTRLEGVG